MQWYHTLAVVAVLFALLIATVILLKKRTSKKTEASFETFEVLKALGEKNVLGLEFLRHKLVVRVQDIRAVNKEMLKETGVVGMNIIGDKIKFYYEEDNEAIYQKLKDALKEKDV